MSTNKYQDIGEALLKKHVRFVPFNEIVQNAMDELDATRPEDIVSFGYDFLDDKLTGLFKGELVVMGGETGTGKTTFATNIIYRATKKHKCAVFALEDRLNDYGMKAVYFELGRVRKTLGLKNYPWNAYRRNEINDLNYLKLRGEAVAILHNPNLYFADIQLQMDVEMLEAAIEDQIAQGVQLFLIDHLHEFDLSKGESTKSDYVEQVLVKLKQILNRTGARCILIAHYRKLNGMKPSMDSFKDSISISQNANYVINLWRDRKDKGDDEFDERFETKIMVPKSRNPNGEFTIDVKFNPDINDYEMDKVAYGTPTEATEDNRIEL